MKLAIKDAGTTQTKTNRDLELGQGYVSRLLSGDRGSKTLSPDLIRKLADYLRVSYEWLAIGRGPMHREGWGASPLEAATSVALSWGARKDAIDAAVTKNRDTPDMTEWDWLSAINVEAARLERARVPRPERVAKEQKRWRTASKKKRRVKVADELAPVERTRRGGAA